MYFGSQLSEVHILYLEGWLHESKRAGEVVTIKHLQSLLLTECNIKASKQVIRRVLKRLGYQWGPAKKVGVRTKRRDVSAILREYLMNYARALELEKSGEYVIVFMDETFLHQRHSKNYTWFHPDHDDKNKVFCGTGKGKRLFIVHAMTKDGLLSVPRYQRQSDDEELDKYAETAEWVFVGPVKKGDYHRNFDGQKFLRLVKERLIPTFQEVHKNNKMILVLDNAPYLHVRGENYIQPAPMKREELFNDLILLAGKKCINIERKGVQHEVELLPIRKGQRGSKINPVPLYR